MPYCYIEFTCIPFAQERSTQGITENSNFATEYPKISVDVEPKTLSVYDDDKLIIML
jgi:hypothetical protein